MQTRMPIIAALLFIILAFLSSHISITGYQTLQNCVDTDGRDYNVKGTATVQGENFVDYCTENKVLVEFFCDTNQRLRFEVKVCDTCTDGMCTIAPVSTSTTATPSSTPSSTSIQIGTVTDALEINENLGDVIDTLTASDTDALRGGSVSTSAGRTDYNQYLRFRRSNEFSSGKIIFGEDEDNNAGNFLYFEDDSVIFEYELQFENGLESELDGTELEDILNEEVNIFDGTFVVTKAKLDGDDLRLEMIGGQAADTLREGQEKIYRINGQEYAVTVFSIDDSSKEVYLTVNGETSNGLEEGEYAVIDNMFFGVSRVIVSEALEGKDLAQLFIGADIYKFRDNDYTDSNFRQGVTISGESFSEGYVQMKGSLTGDDFRLSTLRYRLRADSLYGGDIYIEEGESLTENIDNPEGMLGNWDIVYDGLSDDIEITTIIIDPSGDQYDLEFYNKRNDYYNIPFVENSGGSLVLGDADDALHFIEGTSSSNYIIEDSDYFVLTDDNDKTGVTNILRYTSIDTSNKVLQFDDEAGDDYRVTYSGTEGTDASADLVVSGFTYRVYVGPSPNYNLAIDLDNDGSLDGDEVKIVVNGGGLLDLGSTITPGSDFAITLTTEASEIEGSSSDEVITIDILQSGSSIDLNVPTQSSLSIETASGLRSGTSDYGVHFEQDTDDPDRLTIEYPTSQAIGDVSIVFHTTDTADIDVTPTQPVVPTPPPAPPVVQPPAAPQVVQPDPVPDVPPQPVRQPDVQQPQKVGFFKGFWQWFLGLFGG